ncbi:MAG TPA: glycosyltransferase family 4 protein [Alphaproteobacteria bacterium]|nr:glycosyltransferase family 4 protein [Alphaproteobacteria bacterium]
MTGPRKLRLAYLVTHPIQYQAPLLRRINAEPDIDLTVFFGTDFSARPFVAADFGQTIEWDVPLLEGYRHEVLPAIGAREEKDLGFWKPLNYGLARRLAAGKFDAIWIHGYARWLHWTAMAAARRRAIKVLLRDEATPISAPRGPLKRLAKRGFFFGLAHLVDAFLAIGSLNRHYYVEQGVPGGRIFMMPYAVDNARFKADAAKASASRESFRASLGLEPGRPVLLFAAKLIERKRPLQLIEAFAQVHAEPALRRPYLLFAGDGPLRKPLEETAKRLAPGAVKFLGFQRQTELPRCYDLCDAFILPSGQEAWGLVINEVMCAGRAVIASDMVGAAPDLVRPGENGAVFRTDDVHDLARAIRQVVEGEQRLAAMGRRSLEIIDRWSFEEDVAGLRQALDAVCPGVLAARRP